MMIVKKKTLLIPQAGWYGCNIMTTYFSEAESLNLSLTGIDETMSRIDLNQKKPNLTKQKIIFDLTYIKTQTLISLIIKRKYHVVL